MSAWLTSIAGHLWAEAGSLGVDTDRPDLIGSTELVGVELPH